MSHCDLHEECLNQVTEPCEYGNVFPDSKDGNEGQEVINVRSDADKGHQGSRDHHA